MSDPKPMRCDVLVAGAGVAGVCAAVAAARAGADTVLVERDDQPGGTPVAAMHRFICGLYAGDADRPGEPLNAGLTAEILEGLRRLAPNDGPLRMGRVWVYPFQPARLLAVLQDLIGRESHLRVIYRASVISAEADGSVLRAVDAQGPAGPIRIVPDRALDATGDGALLAACGAAQPAPPAERLPLAGFTARFEGLEGIDESTPIRVPYAAAQGVLDKRLPPNLRFTTFYPGHAHGQGFCKLAIYPEHSRDRARVLEDARVLHAYLASALPTFRRSTLTGTSPRVLLREGRLLDGEYLLTRQDVLAGRVFDDTAARNAWPIELWDRLAGPSYEYLDPGACYGIPARCLRARSVRNLLAAGRCISVTSDALGSTRVMGPCMAVGEAAGRLAAG